jgi:hypothetical protein
MYWAIHLRGLGPPILRSNKGKVAFDARVYDVCRFKYPQLIAARQSFAGASDPCPFERRVTLVSLVEFD